MQTVHRGDSLALKLGPRLLLTLLQFNRRKDDGCGRTVSSTAPAVRADKTSAPGGLCRTKAARGHVERSGFIFFYSTDVTLPHAHVSLVFIILI